MTTRPLARAALAAGLALALAGSAAAQDRPSEEELFGAPPAKEGAPPTPVTPPPKESTEIGSPRPNEAEMFGSQASPAAPGPPPRAEVSREKEDALKVGGMIYLRAATFA